MKRNLQISTIAAMLVASSMAYADNSNSTSGTINFTGSISDTSCEVQTVGENAATIDFGQLASNTLVSAGDLSGTKEFNVVLSGCPTSITAADITFNGSTVASDDNLYAINLSGGASTTAGLKLEVSNTGTSFVNTLDGQIQIDLPSRMDATGVITLPLKAAIQRVGTESLQSGEFTSSANFTITYQ